MTRRVGLLVLVLVACAAPPLQAGSSIGLRLGASVPRADSNLFHDDAELYGTEGSDWVSFAGGGEFAFDLGSRFELGLHVDGSHNSVHTSYRDFTFDSGREITQTLELDTVPMGATLRVMLADRHRSRVVPYVGGGLDALYYQYSEYGDFVDFESPDLDVYEDWFESDGVALGLHVNAGTIVKVGDDLGLTGDVRYTWAGDDMDNHFRGNRIDLSGFTFTVGLQLRLD
jgi:hypothetical protein